MQCEDPQFLVDREGDRITTQAKEEADDCLALPARTWVITEGLEERAIIMTQHDMDLQRGEGWTAGKFLCYDAADPQKTPAFMRIYAQLPIAGTEWSRPSTRAQQAATKKITELVVFKLLKKLGCAVAPDLLGYQEEKQGPGDTVPGGFITYLVWEKVPGESLDYEEFWKMSLRSRNAIRAKFRKVYPYVPLHYTSTCYVQD